MVFVFAPTEFIQHNKGSINDATYNIMFFFNFIKEYIINQSIYFVYLCGLTSNLNSILQRIFVWDFLQIWPLDKMNPRQFACKVDAHFVNVKHELVILQTIAINSSK